MPEDASCSRAKSRVARALLRKRGILSAAVPATCPLHADLYGDQEQHKRALRRSLYKCAYCGKTFSSEDWLDRHFDRKHADTLATDGFCLGDLCREGPAGVHELRGRTVRGRARDDLVQRVPAGPLSEHDRRLGVHRLRGRAIPDCHR